MSGTFDEKDAESGSANKRPTPTIEGTATEISVEPGEGETASEEAAAIEPAARDSTDGVPEDESSAGGDVDGDIGSSEEEATGDDASEPGGNERSGAGGPAPAVASSPSFGRRLTSGIAALFTHALAGVAGGAGVLAALTYGYLPMPASQDTSAIAGIENRIAALESAPKSPDNSAALQSLQSKLAALEAAPKAADKPAADPAEVEAVSKRVSEMEATLKSMAAAAKDGGSVADAAAVSQQVAEAEQRLDGQIDEKIKTQVEAALSSAASASKSEDGEANKKAIGELQTEISGLDAKLKALTEAALSSDDTAKLKPELEALEKRLGSVESTLPELVETVDEESALSRRANLAIAFSSLRDVVNSGRPFATELAMLSTVSPESADLGDLVEYEDAGIPTAAMLKDSFAKLRDKALSVEGNEDDDFVGRLLGSAQSLVKVRRIGNDVEGDTPEAILARAEAGLKAGNLRDAAMEVEKLDGAPAKVFGPWLDDALARLDANSALQGLQDDLLVSLAGQGHGHERALERGPDAAGTARDEEAPSR